MPTIRVDPEVYAAVLAAKSQVEIERGQSASMDDGVRRAINTAAKRSAVHEHAAWMDHRWGTPCAKGERHRGCCPGACD